MSTPVVKIELTDEGQDFTVWYVRAGRVIGCKPFQARVWINTVLTRKAIVGENPNILTRGGEYTSLIYPVEAVTVLSDDEAAPILAEYRDWLAAELDA